MAGALEDLRVLDLSWGMAGPMTTMFLADNGADVIRIESPQGDPFAKQTGYRVWNRGKRSARLDLQSAGEGGSSNSWRGHPMSSSTVSRSVRRRGSVSTTTLSSHAIRVSSRVRSPPMESTPRTVSVPATTGSWRPGRAFSMTRRAGGGRRWSSSMAVPVRTPSSVRPRGSSGAPIGTVRSSRAPPGRASARPTSPRWGSPRRCAAREVTGLGQRVTTSLLQGALAAACLNWQRVEDPDAPLYWMWPVDARSIEGLFECADGKWVHHWTIRPRWVLAAAEGDTLTATGLDTSYRDDPDRVSMEPDGMLAGIFLHGQLAEAFRNSPPTSGSARQRRRDSGSPPSGHRARPWPTNRSSLTVASSRSTIRTRGRFTMRGRCWSSRQHRARSPGQRRARASTPARCSVRSCRAWEAQVPLRSLGSRSHIRWREFASSTSDSASQGRSRVELSPISGLTSSRSTRCTTSTGMGHTWVSV